MDVMRSFTCTTEAKVARGKPGIRGKTLLSNKLEGQERGKRLRRRSKRKVEEGEEEGEEENKEYMFSFVSKMMK